jgi:Diacylglycerol kinase accessory domain
VWNYIDVGMDAKTAYSFDKLRKDRPWLSPTRPSNIFWYSFFACATGWFCGSKPLQQKVRAGDALRVLCCRLCDGLELQLTIRCRGRCSHAEDAQV